VVAAWLVVNWLGFIWGWRLVVGLGHPWVRLVEVMGWRLLRAELP
jgi:hypothetical protein